MTVQQLIEHLNHFPPDCTVIISSGEYPATPHSIHELKKEVFDGYYTPGFAAKRRDKIVVVYGGS